MIFKIAQKVTRQLAIKFIAKKFQKSPNLVTLWERKTYLGDDDGGANLWQQSTNENVQYPVVHCHSDVSRPLLLTPISNANLPPTYLFTLYELQERKIISKWAIRGLFLVFFMQLLHSKNVPTFQRNSNSDRQSRRRARWPPQPPK